MEPNNFVNNNTEITNNTQSQLPAHFDGPIALLKRAFGFFSLHWRSIVPIVALPIIFISLGQLSAFTIDGISLVIFIIITTIISLILNIVSQPAAIDAIRKLSEDSNTLVSLWGQYKFGFSIFWSILFVSVVQILILFGAGILFLIPAIIIFVFLSMYIFTLVLEGKRGFGALTESFRLVKGRWFAVFGRIIFLGLIFVVGGLIFSGLVFIIEKIFQIPNDSTTSNIISVISGLIINTAVGSFSVVYMYMLYQSLKLSAIQVVSTDLFKKVLIFFMILGIVFAGLLTSLGIIVKNVSNKMFSGFVSEVETEFVDEGYLDDLDNPVLDIE